MSGCGRGAQRVTAGASIVAHRRWNSVFRVMWYIFLRGGRGFHIAVYTSRRASEQAKQPRGRADGDPPGRLRSDAKVGPTDAACQGGKQLFSGVTEDFDGLPQNCLIGRKIFGEYGLFCLLHAADAALFRGRRATNGEMLPHRRGPSALVYGGGAYASRQCSVRPCVSVDVSGGMARAAAVRGNACDFPYMYI